MLRETTPDGAGRPARRHPWRGRSTLIAGLVAASLPVVALGSAPAASAAATPLVSTATAELSAGGTAITPSATTALVAGDQLQVTFNEGVDKPSAWSVELTDGSTLASFDASSTTVTQTSADVLDFTLTSGGVIGMQTKDLEVVSASGISAAGGGQWNLVDSGEVLRVDPLNPSDATTPTTCGAIAGHTRFFGGTNCDIGFANPGPEPPDVFDIIPLPTTDLVGPPLDNAPEVITNCAGDSTDTVYDLLTGAQLGQQACGIWPAGESTLGNTTGTSLDYIPTPGLVSFEQVGVVETLPGSQYLSATAVPPQLTGIQVSGSSATFDYNTAVRCETPPPAVDPTTDSFNHTASQYSYSYPWWATTSAGADLSYPPSPESISCPASGSTSITVAYAGVIPAPVRFKFTGYGFGYYIVASTSTATTGERAASESAYYGPAGALVPPDPSVSQLALDSASTLQPSGGTLILDYAAQNAVQCSITGPAGTSVAMQYRDSGDSYPQWSFSPAYSTVPCEEPAPATPLGGEAEVTVPPNTNSNGQPDSYTFTLTASGVEGQGAPATKTLTLTVPAPQPAVSSFAASTSSLASSGGTVALTYATAYAQSCSLSVSPAYPGDPSGPVACGASKVSTVLPANTAQSTASYRFTLTASTPNEPAATASTTVTVAAAAPPVTTTTTTTTTTAPPPPPPPPTPVVTPVVTPAATPAVAPVVPAPQVRPSLTPDVTKIVHGRVTPKGRIWVRIRGTNFERRDTVRFGRLRAMRIRVVNPHLLLALCPPGRGWVQVTVHTARGTSVKVRSSRFHY